VSSALAVSQSVARFDLPTALRADKLALMAAFMGMAIYVSPDGRWQNAPPPDQLDWDSTGLRRRFHGSLLKDQKAFGGGIRLPHHKRVEFEWRGVGQTAGVAFWNRQGRLWAASLVLCGLEDERDMAALRATLADRKLPVPEDAWQIFRRETRRPLLATIHYDIRSVGDPVVATAAPVLAAAFYAMFGTAMQDG
jgi:hypothetical protein